MRKILESKLFIVGAGFVLIFSGIALVRETLNTINIKQEIIQLEKQAQQLSQQNQELKNMVEYLQSPEYQERASREHLNLQKPGEIAVALPQVLGVNQESEDEEGVIENQSVLSLWWNYFFEALQY